MLGVRGMRTVRGAPSLAKLRTGFAHTLIPIALAYLVAHYFSLFVFQEQAQFTYLLSDPLGTGHHRPLRHRLRAASTSRILSANAIWYVQVGALVVGHVARPHPRPRPRPRLLARLPPAPPARSTGCWR